MMVVELGRGGSPAVVCPAQNCLFLSCRERRVCAHGMHGKGTGECSVCLDASSFSEGCWMYDVRQVVCSSSIALVGVYFRDYLVGTWLVGSAGYRVEAEGGSRP